MKKFSIVFSVLLVLGLVLAACSAPQVNTPTPVIAPTDTPAEMTTEEPTSVLPGTGQTATPMMEETITATEELGGAATSTPEATEALTTSTPMATEMMTVTAMPTVSMLTGTMTATNTMTATPMAQGAGLPNTGRADLSRLTNLMKAHVVDMNGKDVGNLSDVVVDLDTFHIDYVALTTSNGRSVLVPWRFFMMRPAAANANNDLSLNADPAVLEAAPAADLQMNMNTDGWDKTYRQFWNNRVAITGTYGTGVLGPTSAAPAATETAMPVSGANPTAAAPMGTQSPGGIGVEPVVLASQLFGYPVRDMKGEDLGTVKDGIVNLNTGELRYLLLAPAASLNLGDKLIPVPPIALPIRRGQNAFTFGASRNVLIQAPNYAPSSFPNARGESWDSGLQNYWQEFNSLNTNNGNNNNNNGGSDNNGKNPTP